MFEDIIKPEIKKIIHELCMGNIHKCPKFTEKYQGNGTWDRDECHFRKINPDSFSECLKT